MITRRIILALSVLPTFVLTKGTKNEKTLALTAAPSPVVTILGKFSIQFSLNLGKDITAECVQSDTEGCAGVLESARDTVERVVYSKQATFEIGSISVVDAKVGGLDYLAFTVPVDVLDGKKELTEIVATALLDMDDAVKSKYWRRPYFIRTFTKNMKDYDNANGEYKYHERFDLAESAAAGQEDGFTDIYPTNVPTNVQPLSVSSTFAAGLEDGFSDIDATSVLATITVPPTFVITKGTNNVQILEPTGAPSTVVTKAATIPSVLGKFSIQFSLNLGKDITAECVQSDTEGCSGVLESVGGTVKSAIYSKQATFEIGSISVVDAKVGVLDYLAFTVPVDVLEISGWRKELTDIVATALLAMDDSVKWKYFIKTFTKNMKEYDNANGTYKYHERFWRAESAVAGREDGFTNIDATKKPKKEITLPPPKPNDQELSRSSTNVRNSAEESSLPVVGVIMLISMVAVVGFIINKVSERRKNKWEGTGAENNI
eukprot:CAMPEP_0194278848 /NCGR_PEP_ID=MMETSP0169-20130528/12414_1 /TAXON_ID=218684 /ORGANISM="Corethron pennatum, Strain L29A3" /LENGTH=488 /DNA_ID=CAMNT_0039023143 /DNA_START=262 /DNA_END=1728 /DNA_ORIENTATION=+